MKPREADSYITKADALRKFRVDFPAAPQVPEAKRLEAAQLLLAAYAGNSAQQGRWEKLVAEVRGDSRVAAKDRFALAAQADFFHVSRDRKLAPTGRMGAYERVARGLVAEFPTETGGYESLLGIARSLPAEKGSALADELAGMPVPENLKLEARQLAARYAMVGQPIDQILVSAGYPDVRKVGSTLVIYAWATWSEGSQVLAERLPQSLGEAVVMGLCLDSDLGLAKEAAATRNLPGTQVYDDRAREGALAQALNLDDVSWIYVVDRSGTIVSVRGQDDLNALQNL